MRKSCATHQALITCIMFYATLYEREAQCLSLTEFKWHLFKLYYIGWTINCWRRGGQPSIRRNPLMTSFRKQVFTSRVGNQKSLPDIPSQVTSVTYTLGATLPCAWHRVSVRTGCSDVNRLWLGEIASWVCNFYLSEAAHKIVVADAMCLA